MRFENWNVEIQAFAIAEDLQVCFIACRTEVKTECKEGDIVDWHAVDGFDHVHDAQACALRRASRFDVGNDYPGDVDEAEPTREICS